MKILIVSDLHGNAESIAALPSDYDRLWVLGDLVNYGPHPKESIEFVRENADLIVRGNHDHAIGFATDPRCSGPYREMAAEMGRLTQALISEEDRSFLRTLPLSVTTEIRGQRFHLCHAAPSDPLFAYRPPESEEWEQEVQGGKLGIGLSSTRAAWDNRRVSASNRVRCLGRWESRTAHFYLQCRGYGPQD